MRTIVMGLAAALVVTGTAFAATSKTKIVGVSFTHPSPNPGYSFICVKVKGTKKSRVPVTIDGPNGSMSGKVKLNGTGSGQKSWKIMSAGTYTFHAGGKTVTLNVPAPPDPASGAFVCPAAP